MSAKFFEHKLRVSISHVDAAARIFYPQLFHLCQEALEHFYEETLSYSIYSMLYEKQKAPVIVSCQADFLSAIRVSDAIILRLSVLEIGKTSFSFGYQVFREKDVELCAKAKTVHVMVDLKKEKKIPIDSLYRKALSQWL